MSSVVQQSPPSNVFEDLIRQMDSLRRVIEQKAAYGQASLAGLSSGRRQSAENLLHYLALRSVDLRPLQDRLARLGLSSLGRVEAHVLATIDTVIHNLYLLNGQQPSVTNLAALYAAYEAGSNCLELNTMSLFGAQEKKRRVHIIVTMPVEAAEDYLMIHQLLISGMNCMRINCAHDDPKIWARMIEHLHNAERATGQSCRVLMDLAGPKLRLGSMQAQPAVLKIKPLRAPDGRIVRPARIWLRPAGSESSEMSAADATLALNPDWLTALNTGDRIFLRDTRGSRRCWRIREVVADGSWAEA